MARRDTETIAYTYDLLDKMGGNTSNALQWVHANIKDQDVAKYLGVVLLGKIGAINHKGVENQ